MIKHILSGLLIISSFFLKGQDINIPFETTEKKLLSTVELSSPVSAMTNTFEKYEEVQNNVNISSTGYYNGIIEGNHSVSLSGGFNYTVPIRIAPGIKGVEPNLALSYNNQGGDGLAGYGWNISGLSTISRIPSTEYHNGYMDPVDLDTNDQFALDGQRLILIAGKVNEYQTENFSNIKIIKSTNYFTVYYPDGSKAVYGSNISSRTDIEWAIVRWQDVNNNTIDYTYSKLNGVIRIAEIKYGHRIGGVPINKIEFTYNVKSNINMSYIGGNRYMRTKVLEGIKVYGNNELLRRYKLDHSDIYYDKVIRLREYNKVGEEKGAISFDYKDLDNSVNAKNYEMRYGPYTGDVEGWNDIRFISGDFEGNGFVDFLGYNNKNKDQLSIYTKGKGGHVNLTDELKGFDEILTSKNVLNGKLQVEDGITIIKDKVLDDKNKSRITFYSSSKIAPSTGQSIGFIKQKSFDIPSYYKYIDYCDIRGGYYEGKAKIPKQYISGDFNGDGITDVIGITKRHSSVVTNSYQSSANTISTNRIAGDCRTTTVYKNGGIAYFFNLDPNSSEGYTTIGSLPLYDVVSKKNNTIQTGDYDGDGKTDLFYIKEGKVEVYSLNQNNKLIKLAEVTDSWISLDRFIATADFNGDGKTDLIFPEKEDGSNWRILLSNSLNGFVSTTDSIVKYEEQAEKYVFNYIPSDFNGDGKTDLLKIKRPLLKSVFAEGATLYLYSAQQYNSVNQYKTNLAYSKQVNVKGIYYNSPMMGGDFDLNTPNPEIGFYTSKRLGSTAVVGQYKSITFNLNYRDEIKLNEVTNNGNGKKLRIVYPEYLNDGTETDYTSYNKGSSELYPFINVNSIRGFNLVKQLEEIVEGKIYRKQDFKYYGAVSHAKGLGFLGFKGVAKTNWYGDGIAKLWSTSLYNPQLRGAITDVYTATYSNFNSIPTNYINKEHYVYTTKLLANPSSVKFNGLPVDLTLSETINNTFKIATRLVVMKPGFSTQGSKGVFKASIGENLGAEGYAGVYVGFLTKVVSHDNLTKQGNTKTYTYDRYWNPIVIRNVNGVGTTEERFEYLNNPSAISGYYMARVKKQTNKSVAYGDSFQSTTEYSYDELGRATRIIKRGNGGSDSLEENLTYDGFGNITKRSLRGTGSSARQESFTYDTTGRFVKEKINIEGLKSTYQNNSYTGLLEKETNHLGLSTTYTYDNWNRPKTVTDYLGKVASYSYKNSFNGGFLVEEYNPEGKNKETYYDAHGRVFKEKVLSLNNIWLSTVIEYDALDRKIKQSEPYTASPSRWTTTKYDQYGRVSEATAPTGRKVTTSYNGLTVSVNDQVQTKTTVKDALGNTVSNEDNGGKITYTYFANGNMKSSSYAGNVIRVEQDHWGRKTKLIDPSAGTYQYKYNVFGEILEEINPKGKNTSTYDVNGRVVQKKVKDADKEYTVAYTFDATTKLLKKASANTDDVNSMTYTYDNYGRAIKVIEDNSRATYSKEMAYDGYGRVASDKTRAKSKAKNQNFESVINYNYELGSGILEKVTDANGKKLYQVDQLNQRGQVTGASFGNGINIINEYTIDGYLSKQQHANSSYASVAMDYKYSFDKIRGNLLSRKNYALSNAYQETFGYDNLDRLTTITSTTDQPTMTYENDGRIKTNSMVGTYNYKAAGTGSIFQMKDLDLNTKGQNLFKDRELQQAQFTSFKKPIHISEEGNGEVSFEYNGALTRSFAEIKKEDGSKHIVKYYSADQSTEIVEDQLTGKSKIIHYFGGPYESNISYIAEYNTNNQVENQGFNYLHRDYLGSLVAISDQNGKILEKRHYGAWGKLEKFESQVNTTKESMLLDRGWTGHEHFAEISLVHMNGRMYDADLGRFLAPDNYVQDPSNTQNFNRYQYAFNNPLKFTDPSGEIFSLSIGLSILVGALIGGATYGIQAAITGNFSWVGLVKSIVIGGISGALSFGIGNYAKSLESIRSVGIVIDGVSNIGQVTNAFAVAAFQIGAHALVGGAMAALQGGSFLAGFAAGGLSSVIASGAMSITKYATNFVKNAVTLVAGTVSGGIGSVLAGGKFLAGAAQGAITTGLNHLAHQATKRLFKGEDPPKKTWQERLKEWAQGVDLSKTADAIIGVIGGTGEIILGVAGEAFTGGISTVLIVDGVYKVVMNGGRLAMYLTGNDGIGDAAPHNVGALVGKIADNVNGVGVLEIGAYQAVGGVTNDIGMFIISGGTGSGIEGLIRTRGVIQRGHGISILSNYYTGYSYGKGN